MERCIHLGVAPVVVVAVVSFAQHFKHMFLLHLVALNCFAPFCAPDMLSPSADPEVPMDYSTEYDASDKSSIDDSDEACSIPGSFSPDNSQDGTNGDQRYRENYSTLLKWMF